MEQATGAHTARGTEERSVSYGGYLLAFLATGEETGGSYASRRGARAQGRGAADARPRAGRGVLLRDRGRDDLLRRGRGDRRSGGTLVLLPRGVPHRFELASDEVRCLNLITPAGFEGFYRELSEPAQGMVLPPAPEGPPDVGRLLSVAARYGCEILPPKGT